MTGRSWVLENARVVTAADVRAMASAIAIVDGRVAAIGDRRDVRAAAPPRAERIDCAGATVLPGLIDPHLHLFALAARRAHIDLAGSRSVSEVLATIARAARRAPRGAWIRAEGLDEAALGRLPTADDLERASPDRPVRIRHRSRHASVLNHRGLRLLGRVGASTSGLIAGHEEEVSRIVGHLPAVDLEQGLCAAGVELARRGITCVADATPRSPRALRPLARIMRSGRFPLRVFAMRGYRVRTWPDRGRLRCGPVKIMVHEEGDRLRPDPLELARRISIAAARGSRVAVHCLGRATLVAALAAFAALPPGRRRGHRLEHVADCPPGLVTEIARLGLTVVTNPAFIRVRGDVYRAEPEGPPSPWLYRAATLLRAGIPLAGASDAPVAPPDPWLGMMAACTRRTRQEVVLGRAERLGRRAALSLFTAGAAHALDTPALGRLAVGGPADLLVAAPDPLRAEAEALAATRVLLTMVDGTIAWRA